MYVHYIIYAIDNDIFSWIMHRIFKNILIPYQVVFGPDGKRELEEHWPNEKSVVQALKQHWF